MDIDREEEQQQSEDQQRPGEQQHPEEQQQPSRKSSTELAHVWESWSAPGSGIRATQHPGLEVVSEHARVGDRASFT